MTFRNYIKQDSVEVTKEQLKILVDMKKKPEYKTIPLIELYKILSNIDEDKFKTNIHKNNKGE